MATTELQNILKQNQKNSDQHGLCSLCQVNNTTCYLVTLLVDRIKTLRYPVNRGLVAGQTNSWNHWCKQRSHGRICHRLLLWVLPCHSSRADMTWSPQTQQMTTSLQQVRLHNSPSKLLLHVLGRFNLQNKQILQIADRWGKRERTQKHSK